MITESGSESRYEFNKISDLENATAGKEEDGTPYIAFTVDKDHQEFGGTFENAAISSSIKVIKRGNSKTKKLKGVTFKIEKSLLIRRPNWLLQKRPMRTERFCSITSTRAIMSLLRQRLFQATH